MQLPLGLGVSAVGSVGPGPVLSPGKLSEALASPQCPRLPRQGGSEPLPAGGVRLRDRMYTGLAECALLLPID